MPKSVNRYLGAAIVSATLLSNLLPPVTAATASTESDIPAGDMCGHVQNRAVRALIVSPEDGSFSVDTIREEPGKLTCVWSSLKVGAPDGSAPDATVTLDLYHFASVARARIQLRGFGIAPHRPQLVQTDDADDEVIQLSPHMKAARHGAEIAVAQATVPQSISSRPDWNARFEALTLTGSGAQVLALPKPPGMASQAGGASSVVPQWMPPPHAAPAGSRFYDPVLAVIATAAKMPNPFFIFPCLLIGSLLLAFLLPGKGMVPGRGRVGWRIALVVFGIGIGVFNLAYGYDVATMLIYHYGATGTAVVTGSYQTNVVYNNHDVQGFNILIRTENGKVIEAHFETDDFNVYPPRNSTTYPDVGDVFTVRYLPRAPQTFVIVADDDSPWVQGLRCHDLNQAVSDASEKTDFAPDNASYRAAYAQAVAAAQQAGCGSEREGNALRH